MSHEPVASTSGRGGEVATCHRFNAPQCPQTLGASACTAMPQAWRTGVHAWSGPACSNAAVKQSGSYDIGTAAPPARSQWWGPAQSRQHVRLRGQGSATRWSRSIWCLWLLLASQVLLTPLTGATAASSASGQQHSQQPQHLAQPQQQHWVHAEPQFGEGPSGEWNWEHRQTDSVHTIKPLSGTQQLCEDVALMAQKPQHAGHQQHQHQHEQQKQQQQQQHATGQAAGPQRRLLLDAPATKAITARHGPPGAPLTGKAREQAAAALQDAINKAETPQGISGGLAGLTLEERILMARLLGHEVRGSFDAISLLPVNSKAYWQALERELSTSPNAKIKQMFEGTWYKCGKLNSGLTMRANTTRALEQNALPHVLSWLGLQESVLPRPGMSADFDRLVAILQSINATAQLVLDPVPYLQTQQPPTDRNGFPMLIHMTFKDKDAYMRHHIISMASWALANPDYRILMYDDSDLQTYMSYDSDMLALYNSLKTPVERSDLWRYSVMCKHGGIYTDADTLCVRPVQEWNRENGHDAEVLLGAEDVFRRDPNSITSWGVRQGRIGVQFEQWTLAGAPQQPVFCRMGELISGRLAIEREAPTESASAEPNWSILHRTGPHVWTDSVLQWMHEHEIGFHEALQSGGKLVQNTRVMPAETFGCAAHFFANDTRLDDVLVMHMFRGVWRTQLKHKRRHKSAKHLLELSSNTAYSFKAAGGNGGGGSGGSGDVPRRHEHLGF